MLFLCLQQYPRFGQLVRPVVPYEKSINNNTSRSSEDQQQEQQNNKMVNDDKDYERQLTTPAVAVRTSNKNNKTTRWLTTTSRSSEDQQQEQQNNKMVNDDKDYERQL
jgi:hypothetical protein